MIRPAALLLLLASLLSLNSAYSQETPTEEPDRAARLAFLRELAAEYQLVIGGDRVARMSPQPVYRWSHPIGSTADGISFVWMDDEQPVVLGSMMILRDGTLSGE